MNSNAIHNILNIVIALTSAVTAGLIATGCTVIPTGTLDCGASWIDPAYTTGAVAVLAFAKTLINVFRDGLGGLFRPQPPVEKP